MHTKNLLNKRCPVLCYYAGKHQKQYNLAFHLSHIHRIPMRIHNNLCKSLRSWHNRNTYIRVRKEGRAYVRARFLNASFTPSPSPYQPPQDCDLFAEFASHACPTRIIRCTTLLTPGTSSPRGPSPFCRRRQCLELSFYGRSSRIGEKKNETDSWGFRGLTTNERHSIFTRVLSATGGFGGSRETILTVSTVAGKPKRKYSNNNETKEKRE